MLKTWKKMKNHKQSELVELGNSHQLRGYSSETWTENTTQTIPSFSESKCFNLKGIDGLKRVIVPNCFRNESTQQKCEFVSPQVQMVYHSSLYLSKIALLALYLFQVVIKHLLENSVKAMVNVALGELDVEKMVMLVKVLEMTTIGSGNCLVVPITFWLLPL